jgi:phosphoserine aminotransferase
MNVTWRLNDTSLEEIFLKEAFDCGLGGLKGHRSIGGIRASLYNYISKESVIELVRFMKKFEEAHR